MDVDHAPYAHNVQIPEADDILWKLTSEKVVKSRDTSGREWIRQRYECTTKKKWEIFVAQLKKCIQLVTEWEQTLHIASTQTQKIFQILQQKLWEESVDFSIMNGN